MSEIEKMYKNAEVKKLLYCDICKAQEYALGLCAETKCEPVCPPFTAEKQINLIIFLANREIRISPTYISSGYYLNDLSKIKSSRNISTFENSLAQHINAIWQDLTEEEKQQVKGILE